MDIQLITINDDNSITLLSSNNIVTGRTAAVQRCVMAMLNTPGSMIEAPYWGGGVYNLFLSRKIKDDSELRIRLSNIVRRAEESLLENEPDEEFAITSLRFLSFTRLDRGVSFEVYLEFAGAPPESVTIPLDTITTETGNHERNR